jgi:molybdenum cofactor synthesis domain-containing protein
MIPLDEAVARVLAGCPPPEVATVGLQEALGCVTAGQIVATELIPPFDNTAVDGYALRADDTAQAPVTLHVVGEIRAGQAELPPVGVGEAVRIMTGAPIPPGADAVVMVEDTELGPDGVRVGVVVPLADAVRRAGDDVRPGDVVLAEGVVLRPAHLGVIAELGHAEVAVYRRLRVGVLSTGDELVRDGSPLAPGQIRESNLDLVLALVARAGCVPVDLGIVPDDEGAITAAFEDGCARCDAIITTGGVSMGDYDLVKLLLDKLGRMDWMQIAIRPAKPFAFGLLGEGPRPTPVFGLPGNPVSSLVSFTLLALPGLRSMMGHREPRQPLVRAIADRGLRRPPADDKVHWQRVVSRFGEDGRLHVETTGAQGSHQLANSAAANAFARLADAPGVEPGGEVEVLLIE